jgi:hypothetical protein
VAVALGPGGVGLPVGPAVQGAVRADLVVVAREPGELALQAGDLALGLGVVGAGVVEPDAEAAVLDLEGDPAAAAGGSR